ncbi:MAG TPA: O-acetylhomoserine aminocarboxypropyltransferase/cysteine synthase [Candidatus Ignatzschineria merdigallinarum]|uniref:O-acetylhomoserine aminocarboxypropyltransferase/cysteine synthase n=1 Tax=Candidatus Ignatzschineria merdigallinarum TaxID=2838621 RepID=A0A9D1TTZ3_9GAMM|nr:O-acetylhomoserine aminocarboxypropyltransferase/cysteine synthase [Candidatus Ignatzschineria merdigallinarum]
MTDQKWSFDTLQVHAGQVVDDTKSRAVPIYQTSSYVFDNSQHAADLFGLAKPGNIYTRIMNPTTDVLEKRIAALEGGVGALATSSGMTAILYAILNVATPGDEIITLSTIYGGTYTLLEKRLPAQFGIKVHFIEPEDLEGLEAVINDKTKAIFFESIGNPDINIPNIEKIVKIAQKHQIVTIADNTFGTPYLINLKSYGINVIVHSLTKYIGGHGTSIGGGVIDNGNFNFKDNPRYPGFNTPDAAYGGLQYADLGEQAYILKARVELLRDTGACISPFNSFLILLGLETLSLRVERMTESALKIAKHLENHPLVAWVKHPGLQSSQYHERAQKYFPKGVGAIFTFGVKGGKEASIKFIDHLEIFSLLANVADAKSLVIHPAGTTHAQLDEEGLRKAGVLPELIRLSIGLEDVNDLIADIDQALEKSQK